MRKEYYIEDDYKITLCLSQEEALQCLTKLIYQGDVKQINVRIEDAGKPQGDIC
jgi:hypothetical protein